MASDLNSTFERITADWALGDTKAAIRRILQVPEFREDFRLLSALGYLYLTQNRFLLAARCYRAAFTIKPWQVDPLLSAMLAALRGQRITVARRYLLAAERIAPKSPKLLRAKAMLYAATGEQLNAFRTISELPDHAIFSSMDNNNIERLKTGRPLQNLAG